MRTTLLFADDLTQVVLSPETDAERRALDCLHEGDRSLSVHRGDFRECRGGYVRDYSPTRGTFETVPLQSDTVLVVRPDRSVDPGSAAPGDVEEAVLRAVRGTPLDRHKEGRFPVGGGGAVGASVLREELAVTAVAAVRSALGTRTPPPDDVDLGKRSDGTWVYRNHAGTWQGCPPPFPPDRTHEVALLREQLREINRIASSATDRTVGVDLTKISDVCYRALGDGK